MGADERKTRETAFSDLEDMLFRGFIVSSAEINGATLLLKSLTPAEITYASWQAKSLSDSGGREWAYLITMAIFMMDGVNVLPLRSEFQSQMLEVLFGMSDMMQSLIIREISALTERSTGCMSQVEGYAFSSASRQYWASYRNSPLNDSAVTGIPGTAQLGLNTCQHLWIALQRLEDQRVEHEAVWENAKFIASAQNSKGVRQVDQKDQARRKRLEEDRRKAYNIAAGLEEDDGAKEVWVTAESTEDLQEQMRKVRTGEKDLHDIVVERYERQLREDRDAVRAEIRELHAVAVLRDGPSDTVEDAGLSLEQVNSRVESARRRMALEATADAQRPERARVSAGLATMLDKYAAPSGARLLAELTEEMTPDDSANRILADGTVVRKIAQGDAVLQGLPPAHQQMLREFADRRKGVKS
jgi:hypothetical protein